MVACDPSLDKTGLTTIKCERGDAPLVGVRPVVEPDYVEVRSAQRGTRSRGERCATARDRGRCEEDYAAVDFVGGERLLFGQTLEGWDPQIVIATDSDGVRVMRTADEVLAWLGPIDSPGDAVARVQLAGYDVRCGDIEGGAVGESDGGYRVLATYVTSACAPLIDNQFLLSVSPDGTIRELDSRELSKSEHVCIGRKPEGLASYQSDAGSPLGRWLAEVAHLEAASVASFERLADELTRFGAPAALVGGALAARDDEIRHAKAMGALARRHGAEVAPPVVAPFAERSLEAFAIENAVEGCVLETFGAVVGLAQAERAADRDVRRVMRTIARDEARHGELAWAVDAWVRTQLDADAQRRVRVAREEAARALLSAGGPRLDAVTARRLGLPVGEAHQRLAEAFVAELGALEALPFAA